MPKYVIENRKIKKELWFIKLYKFYLWTKNKIIKYVDIHIIIYTIKFYYRNISILH